MRSALLQKFAAFSLTACLVTMVNGRTQRSTAEVLAFKRHNWAAAGFIDILLRWKMKLEVGHGTEKEIQPGVQIRGCQAG